MGSFFDLFDLSWSGKWGLWLQRALQTLDIILLIVILIVSVLHRVSLKAFDAPV